MNQYKEYFTVCIDEGSTPQIDFVDWLGSY